MCVCGHVGVHAGEVMMNIRAVKVSRGVAVDGKAPLTAKQTTQEKKLSKTKVLRVKSLVFMTQHWLNDRAEKMPAPVMAGILLMMPSFLQIFSWMLCNVSTLL